MRAFPAFSHDHSLSSLLFLFQWHYRFLLFFFFTLMPISFRKKEIIVRFHVHLSPLGGFVRPSFSSSEIMSFKRCRSAVCPAVCLPLLALQCLYRDKLEAQSFTSNTLLMFWLCSFLFFFVLVPSGWPLGLPGDRWWRVWDKDIQ